MKLLPSIDLPNLPELFQPVITRDPTPQELARMAKHRWIIERDYEELKQELGLGHEACAS